MNQNDILAFLGFLNYHKDHLKDFSSLYDLAHTKRHFLLDDTHEEAFLRAKTTLVTAPCLSYQRPDGLFVLNTNASDIAINAALHMTKAEKKQ